MEEQVKEASCCCRQVIPEKSRERVREHFEDAIEGHTKVVLTILPKQDRTNIYFWSILFLFQEAPNTAPYN